MLLGQSKASGKNNPEIARLKDRQQHTCWSFVRPTYDQQSAATKKMYRRYGPYFSLSCDIMYICVCIYNIICICGIIEEYCTGGIWRSLSLSLVHLSVLSSPHAHIPSLSTNTAGVRACAEASRGAAMFFFLLLGGPTWRGAGTALVVGKTTARLALPGGTELFPECWGDAHRIRIFQGWLPP